MPRPRNWSGPIPADEQRCTRNDGKNWRCYAPRHPGAIYCEKHQLAYLAKCRPKPRPPNPNPSPNPPPKTPSFRVSETAPPRSSDPDPDPGQVWAFSQNPNRYARIDRKIPSQSSVLATPLIPHPVLREEILRADSNGRFPSCGTFRTSARMPMMVADASTFAFQMVGVETVKWMGIKFYRIFPNKGEVWAVESKDGGEGDVRLVEVVSDFSEEEGVTVAGLVPVGERREGGGFYERHLHEGFRLVQTFERKEMVMFSHRVAAKRVDVVEGDKQLWKVAIWKNLHTLFLIFHGYDPERAEVFEKVFESLKSFCVLNVKIAWHGNIIGLDWRIKTSQVLEINNLEQLEDWSGSGAEIDQCCRILRELTS